VNSLETALGQLSSFDLFVIFANLFLLVFASQVVKYFSREKNVSTVKNRLGLLRLCSFVLLSLYLLPLSGALGEQCTTQSDSDVASCPSLRQISLSGLTVLLSYGSYIILHAWIVRRFGRTRKVEEQEVFTSTYQSELFTLMCLIAVVIVAFLSILSIWGVEEWLQSTSVLGGILVVLFFTKDVWLPDLINGLIVLYKKDIEPGSVIRIPEMDITAIVLRTSLIQTVLRDLTHRHQIILPNSKLRACRIELLTKYAGNGLQQTVDFKIGYDASADDVIAMLSEAWKQASEAESSINKDSEARIVLLDNGDHARVWRLFYSVGNVYRLNQARFAINRAASDASEIVGIGLNTPLTHLSLSSS